MGDLCVGVGGVTTKADDRRIWRPPQVTSSRNLRSSEWRSSRASTRGRRPTRHTLRPKPPAPQAGTHSSLTLLVSDRASVQTRWQLLASEELFGMGRVPRQLKFFTLQPHVSQRGLPTAQRIRKPTGFASGFVFVTWWSSPKSLLQRLLKVGPRANRVRCAGVSPVTVESGFILCRCTQRGVANTCVQ